ncbi:MAG: transposase [Chitinophagaceae bacterium]|nr:transposase [Chitinophagaceae bacterium]
MGWDEGNQQKIERITHQMNRTAGTFAQLYKCRRQVEIFFRDVEQLLHIKSFIGTSENAVLIQIWTH